MARRFPRQFDERLLKEFASEEDEPRPSDFLKGVQVWDLISAFSQVVRTLGYSQPREVVYDDTPVEEAAEELLARIEREKSLLFSQLFVKGADLSRLITMFLAVLELVRQRRIGAEQQKEFGDVRLFLRDPSKEEPPKPITPKGARQSRDALERKGPRRPSAHQSENLREIMEDVEFEKTEFDEILDSIQVPEVEAFRPIYTDDEIMGRKEPEAAGDCPLPHLTGTRGRAGAAGSRQPRPPADADPDLRPPTRLRRMSRPHRTMTTCKSYTCHGLLAKP